MGNSTKRCTEKSPKLKNIKRQEIKSKKTQILLLTLLTMAFAATRAGEHKENLKSHVPKQKTARVDGLQDISQTKSLKELFRSIGDIPGNIAASIVAGTTGKKNAQYDDTVVRIIATIITALPFVATTEACGSRTKEYFDDFSTSPIQNAVKMAIYAFGTGIGAFCTSAVTLSLVMHFRKKLSQ